LTAYVQVWHIKIWWFCCRIYFGGIVGVSQFVFRAWSGLYITTYIMANMPGNTPSIWLKMRGICLKEINTKIHWLVLENKQRNKSIQIQRVNLTKYTLGHRGSNLLRQSDGRTNYLPHCVQLICIWEIKFHKWHTI
jgi:hypothetical protein